MQSMIEEQYVAMASSICKKKKNETVAETVMSVKLMILLV